MKNKTKYVIYGVILVVIFIVSIVGTYAYYSFSVTNSSVIAGSVSNINATLTVTRVVGDNSQMVPMYDNALSNALLGTGGVSPCIDGNSNLSCQVYRITLQNNGGAISNLNGIVTLEANSGSTYTNLKWQELTYSSSQYSTKSGSSANGMTGGKLITNGTLSASETKTWYIAVWISEIGSNQTNTDKGTFKGTVSFNNEEEIITGNLVTYLTGNNIITPILDTTAGVDFSQTSVANNTNGLYLLSSTSSDPNPIYYYRGAVDNNLIYADFCWKVVRTTEYGGLKLIYNGVPSGTAPNRTCNNTDTDSQIGTVAWNIKDNDAAYVGYMFGGTLKGDSGDDLYTLTTYTTTVEEAQGNIHNSTIKDTIDDWYAENMTSYTSRLESVVFCNDRSFVSGTGYGAGSNYMNPVYYSGSDRLYTNKTPSLVCNNASNDLFSTSSASSGNHALIYPVGLITADEVAMAGAVYTSSNSNFYLFTGQSWWTGTPQRFELGGASAREFLMRSSSGIFSTDFNSSANGVRPVISLASGYTISDGDGSTSSPFIVN